MQFIYEPPWLAVAALFVAGIGIFAYGNNRLNNRLKLAGGLVALLGLLLGLAGHFLQSERERIDATTRALLTSIEKRNWAQLRSYLHKDVEVFTFHGADVVAERAQSAAEGMDLKSLTVVSAKTELVDDDQAKMTIQIVSDGKYGQAITYWDLKWEKSPAGAWLLYDIDPLGGPGIGPSDMGSWVQGR